MHHMLRRLFSGQSSGRPLNPKKDLLTLVIAVVVLDAIAITVYHAAHIPDRTIKIQESFIAVWVVLTLIVVTPMMKRIRQARRRR
jgi:hypothetical protein